MTRELRVVSMSRASDGSFTAISEIGALLVDSPYRLIGGVAVVLHQLRLGLEHPIRATADADFGVPPYALHDDSLIEAVASLGYRKVAGNRWSRSIDQTREANRRPARAQLSNATSLVGSGRWYEHHRSRRSRRGVEAPGSARHRQRCPHRWNRASSRAVDS